MLNDFHADRGCRFRESLNPRLISVIAPRCSTGSRVPKQEVDFRQTFHRLTLSNFALPAFRSTTSTTGTTVPFVEKRYFQV